MGELTKPMSPARDFTEDALLRAAGELRVTPEMVTVYCADSCAEKAMSLAAKYRFDLVMVPVELMMPNTFAWAVKCHGRIVWSTGC